VAVYLKKNNRIVGIGVRENKMFLMVLRTRPLQHADQANVMYMVVNYTNYKLTNKTDFVHGTCYYNQSH